MAERAGTRARPPQWSAHRRDRGDALELSLSAHRFGSLSRAYQLIAYTPERDLAFIEINRRLRRVHGQVVEDVVRSLEQHGGAVIRDAETDVLLVNGMLAVSIVIARCRTTATDATRWTICLDAGLTPDLTVAVRMDPSNETPLDYYILPSLDIRAARLRLKEDNGIFLDGYRYETLDYLFGLAATARIGAVA